MRPLIRTLILALFLAAPTAALATPTFPEVIRQTLNASTAPACSVCHAGGETGRGTVTTPFGQAMMARGLSAGDETSLRAALGSMETDKVDSNKNGILDVDELRAGRNPNVDPALPQLGYGCAFIKGAACRGGAYAWLVLLVVVWAVRRRRSKDL